MILTTHAVIGAAVVSLIPTHPILGIALAFGSHFALDAIPHWDYSISSDYTVGSDGLSKVRLDLKFLFDVLKTSIDALLGLSIAYVFFFNPLSPFLWLLGGMAAILPDFFHLAYSKLPYFPLKQIQNFHHFIHSKVHIRRPVLGPFLQTLLILIVVLITR